MSKIPQWPEPGAPAPAEKPPLGPVRRCVIATCSTCYMSGWVDKDGTMHPIASPEKPVGYVVVAERKDAGNLWRDSIYFDASERDEVAACVSSCWNQGWPDVRVHPIGQRLDRTP